MKRLIELQTSTLQPTFFDANGPVCDLCLEKGFDSSLLVTKSGSESDRLFWLSDNPNDVDFKGTLDSSRSVILADVIETKGENFVVLGYTPRTLCIHEENGGVEAWWDWNNVEIESMTNFKFFDFLTGYEIRGVDSDATAFITEIGTTCCDGNFIIAAYFSSKTGNFIPGERIQIEGIDITEIQRAFATQANRYSNIPGFFENVLDVASQPYFVQDGECQTKAECLTFRKVKGIPTSINLDYTSFSRETVRSNGCSDQVVSKMTLKYSPEILCNFSSQILCDWDSVAIETWASFPFFDFLTGQKIKGWHSTAEATVSSIKVKREVSGERLIIVTLVDQTRDFLESEPIEIISKSEESIWESWSSQFATYGAIPGFFDWLRTMVKRPYQTASNLENAICSGQVDDILANLSRKIAGVVDGKKSEIVVSLIPSNYFLTTCRERCVHYPEDLMLLRVTFPNEEIGSEARVKFLLAEIASVNGVGYGELLETDILPETSESTVYLNDTEYSLTPIQIEVKNSRMSNRVFTMDNILSEAMSCEYPLFASFMQTYMRYSNSRGQGKEYMLNSLSYADINTAPNTLLETMAVDNIQPLECVPHLVESRAFQKQFNAFWKQNNKVGAYSFLFEQVWGKNVCVSSPCNKVFRASADQCDVKEYLYLMSAEQALCVHDATVLATWDPVLLDALQVFADEILSTQVGQTIRGLESRSTAFIEEVDTTIDKRGVKITRVCISRKAGQFLPGEPIEVMNVSLNSIAKAAYSEIDDLPPGFLDNLLKLQSFWFNIGNIPGNYEIVAFSGSFKPKERLWFSGTYTGCQNSPVTVRASLNGVPLCLEDIHDAFGNYGFSNSSNAPIRLEQTDPNGTVTGWIDVTFETTDTEVNALGWRSRNSFTDDIVVLNDNYLTTPDAFVVTTDMSRNEYLDIYRKTLHEAGSFMLSEYPIHGVVKSADKTTSVIRLIEYV